MDAKKYCVEIFGQVWNDELNKCEYVNDLILSKRLGGSKRYTNMIRNLAHKPRPCISSPPTAPSSIFHSLKRSPDPSKRARERAKS